MPELSKGRQAISQVRTFLRQGKPQPAIEALYSGLVIMIKHPLLKVEREQFETLVADAISYLSMDTMIRQVFPLTLEYVRGSERALLQSLEELRLILDENIHEGAKDYLKELEDQKLAMLETAEAELKASNKQEALDIFEEIKKKFPDDILLLGTIGELLLKYTFYEEAATELEIAIDRDPTNVQLYNSIGMACRKLKLFERAEHHFLKASQYTGKNAYLLFNLGRVYVDAENWPKALEAANSALELQADFVEAQRMATYVQKKIDKA